MCNWTCPPASDCGCSVILRLKWKALSQKELISIRTQITQVYLLQFWLKHFQSSISIWVDKFTLQHDKEIKIMALKALVILFWFIQLGLGCEIIMKNVGQVRRLPLKSIKLKNQLWTFPETIYLSHVLCRIKWLLQGDFVKGKCKHLKNISKQALWRGLGSCSAYKAFKSM